MRAAWNPTPERTAISARATPTPPTPTSWTPASIPPATKVRTAVGDLRVQDQIEVGQAAASMVVRSRPGRARQLGLGGPDQHETAAVDQPDAWRPLIESVDQAEHAR